MHPSQSGPYGPRASITPAPARRTGGYVGTGVVLLVTAVATAFASGIPDALTHSIYGDGEGEGSVGVIKLYVSAQVANAFLALALVLAVAALTCFAVALVRRLTRS